jgi:hypothetical protein
MKLDQTQRLSPPSFANANSALGIADGVALWHVFRPKNPLLGVRYNQFW